MMTTLTLIRCVLCQGTLPGVQDEVFLAHMRDHHRTFHNMDFMFAASFLTEENIEITVDFMKMNNNNETPDDNEPLVDVKETKYELLESKDTFNNHESDNENTQTLVNGTIEITKDEDIKIEKESKRKYQSKITPVKCHYCDKQLISEKFHQRHIQTCQKKTIRKLTQHSPSKSGICLFCGKEFSNTTGLQTHIKVVHDEEKHTCDLCGKEINGTFMLNKHKKLFHKALEPCPHCGKMVKRMTQHIKTNHLKNEEKKYQCRTCGKGFVRKAKLEDHERIHSDIRQFLCRVGKEECGHRSKLSGNRNKHEKLCKFIPI